MSGLIIQGFMKPILSIDVSKEKSVAGAFLDQPPLGKPKVFLHTRKELLKLSAFLKELEQSYLAKPQVVMEATGNYSKPLALLHTWPTPAHLLKASVDEIADVLKPSMRPLSWRKAKAQKALDAAGESVGCRSTQTSAVISIRHTVELLVHFQDILTDIRAQMNAIAARSPQYELLRTVPGIGEVTACVILSEVGDINRFATKKQLIAYAGMDPAVFQSGQFTARNNHISKRGSPYLRKALYQAAFVGIAERKDQPVNPVIRRFYDLKKSQGKPVKVALCAAASKLLCMVFGIMKSGKPFEVRYYSDTPFDFQTFREGLFCVGENVRGRFFLTAVSWFSRRLP